MKSVNQPHDNYATVFLAVMESPAILVGVVLGKLFLSRGGGRDFSSLKAACHEALFGRSIFLLVGALVVGTICGKLGMESFEAFPRTWPPGSAHPLARCR